jgi:hypothetical protein
MMHSHSTNSIDLRFGSRAPNISSGEARIKHPLLKLFALCNTSFDDLVVGLCVTPEGNSCRRPDIERSVASPIQVTLDDRIFRRTTDRKRGPSQVRVQVRCRPSLGLKRGNGRFLRGLTNSVWSRSIISCFSIWLRVMNSCFPPNASPIVWPIEHPWALTNNSCFLFWVFFSLFFFGRKNPNFGWCRI